MHYQDLLIAHKAYHQLEKRSIYYNHYMEGRKLSEWETSPSYCEIFKLFGFILSWDPYFQGDVEKFKKTYEKISPLLKELKHIRLEEADFNDKNLSFGIAYVFDEIARCSRKYESTDASKILHVLHPHLFVMWDRSIRRGTLGNEDLKDGKTYAEIFLPMMQSELDEAVRTLIVEIETKELMEQALWEDFEEYDSLANLWWRKYCAERERWKEAMEDYVIPQTEEEADEHYYDFCDENFDEGEGEIDEWAAETADAYIDEIREEIASYKLDDLEEPREEWGEPDYNCGRDVRAEALETISRLCDGETLPKIIDEYNYMIYTKRRDFGNFLIFMKEKNLLKEEDYKRLMKKMRL